MVCLVCRSSAQDVAVMPHDKPPPSPAVAPAPATTVTPLAVIEMVDKQLRQVIEMLRAVTIVTGEMLEKAHSHTKRHTKA